MILLLHGDDIEASRNRLTALKAESGEVEVRQIDGKNLDKTTLIQSLESTSLFALPILVVIENLFAKLGRKQKLIIELVEVLKRAPETTKVVLWEATEVGSTVIKALGKASIEVFKTPVVIFQFLDSIKPNSANVLLPLYHKVRQSEAEELLLFMLQKRLHQLIMARDGVAPEGMASWQLSRLTNQAKLFTIIELTSMLKQLVDIEYKLKTGQSPYSLNASLEYFFASN